MFDELIAVDYCTASDIKTLIDSESCLTFIKKKYFDDEYLKFKDESRIKRI